MMKIMIKWTEFVSILWKPFLEIWIYKQLDNDFCLLDGSLSVIRNIVFFDPCIFLGEIPYSKWFWGCAEIHILLNKSDELFIGKNKELFDNKNIDFISAFEFKFKWNPTIYKLIF